jgi:RNA polymerase sigma-70 factor (ECF subfamily)
MPPLRSWFQGREAITAFLRLQPLSGDWRWRVAAPTRANGQVALGYYTWSHEAKAYERFALNVITFRGREIAAVDAFLTRTTEDPDPETLARLPEHPFDPGRVDAAFERLGLPEQLA